MKSISIGKLKLSADATGVTFAVGGEGVKIAAQDVGDVEEFLRLFAPHERRVGFRVPMGSLKDSVRQGVKLRVRKGFDWIDAVPVDLSLTGILIKVEDLVVATGSRIALRLEFNDHSCELIGAVVRRDGDLLAAHFTDVLKKGELDPPEALLTVYRALEQEWLKSRLV